MIELNHDQLSFHFPEIDQELRDLLQAYETRILPRILSENRQEALDDYLSRRRRWSEDGHRKAVKHLTQLTDRGIRDALHRAIAAEAPGSVCCQISFQRTLRLPEDSTTYDLPPGLGLFPLRHVDDFADRVPPSWIERGGVMMPMYQAEALWINFDGDYPIALKLGSGRINAITGEEWKGGLQRVPQDYLVIPDQPWLDGFAISKGVIRQFVAMPLGEGYSVEEQVTGQGEYGGIQLQAFPMKATYRFEQTIKPRLPRSFADLLPELLLDLEGVSSTEELFDMGVMCCSAGSMMGLGMGGRMRQEIYEDDHGLAAWDIETTSRCFVHLCNALQWREITGDNPPQTPVTAKEYERAGLPWFDYYRDDLAVLEGSKTLAGLKSVGEKRAEKNPSIPPTEVAIKVPAVVSCGPKKRPEQVREWVE